MNIIMKVFIAIALILIVQVVAQRNTKECYDCLARCKASKNDEWTCYPCVFICEPPTKPRSLAEALGYRVRLDELADRLQDRRREIH